MVISRNVLGFLIGASLTASVAVGVYFVVPARFPEGMTTAGVTVSGMTRGEAVAAVAAFWEERRDVPIRFSGPALGRAEYTYTPEEIGLSLDPEATVAAAARVTHPVRFRFLGRDGVRPAPSQWRLDDAKFDAFAAELAKHETESRPPKVRYLGGKVVLIRGKRGTVLDRAGTIAAVQTAVLSRGDRAEPVFAPAPPDPAEAVFAQVDTELGSWTTRFSSGNSRSHNIKLATDLLDQQILLPGQSLSYNDTVGPREQDRGFRIAPTFARGRHVPDYGGGVCQVSSTLYNAALLAGLEISERHNHQMLVDYVPTGRDATVDFGKKDLVFVNSTDAPVVIVSEYVPGKVTFRVLGSSKASRHSYKIVVTDKRSYPFETVEEIDPDLPAGKEKVVEKGCVGMRSRTWRYAYDGDRLLKKELLSRDYYMPSKRIVKKGPPLEEETVVEEVSTDSPPDTPPAEAAGSP